MRKPVYCLTCGKERNPKCRPGQCVDCRTHDKQKNQLAKEHHFLKENGYIILTKGQPPRNNLGKAVYELIRSECGHNYTAVFHNIRKQIVSLGIAPCTICGAEKRMNACMSAFIDKYGRDYDISNYEDYRSRVRNETEKTYRLQQQAINPNDVDRGRTEWHLDHIVPVIYGFKYAIAPELIGSVQNLQMLPFDHNIRKHAHLTKEAKALLKKWQLAKSF